MTGRQRASRVAGSTQEQRVSALFVTHPELTALGCALAAVLVTFLTIWAWPALVRSLAGPSAAGMRKSRSENTADVLGSPPARKCGSVSGCRQRMTQDARQRGAE